MTSEAADREPLTPAHLLYGRRIITLPYNDKLPEPKPFTPDTVTKQARVQTSLIKHLRDRWRHEYLTSLRQNHKTTGQNDQSITVGDVVLIHYETHRAKWKMGTIEQSMTGRDDLTRSALVCTGNGQSTDCKVIPPWRRLLIRAREDVVRTSAGTKSVTLVGTTRRWRERRTDDDVVWAGCYCWSCSYELYNNKENGLIQQCHSKHNASIHKCVYII